MPRIISYTPSWLARPSPGFQLFDIPVSSPSSTQYHLRGPNPTEYSGPNKTIACRGTEVFIVAGKTIRWSDLSLLKAEDDELQATPSKKPKLNGREEKAVIDDNGPEDGSYRVLKISTGEKIRQLSISPNGNLLAIATSHTVQIAILPDPSLLGQVPNKAIKLKTYTVGPTSHVLSQGQVTNILWHPYGVARNCLVTVTTDAIVRLWECNPDNRWSFDSPALAIDLKKLMIGSSEEEDFTPDEFGKNKRYTSDALGLELASASFGGRGLSDESPWSATTLWLATKGGDVYALCPLLPSTWEPSSTFIPALAGSVVENPALNVNGEEDTLESRHYRDRFEWIRSLDSQEPISIQGEDGTEIQVYNRPANPGAVPRLQGPFQMFSEEVDEDLELSDIYVIAGSYDLNDLREEDDVDSEAQYLDERGVGASIICLLTRTGRLYICLDLEGVEGQWLPRKKPKLLLPPPTDPYLVTLEALDSLRPSESLDLEWPTFTPDVDSPYSFFTTHSRGVFFFSLEPWVQSVEKELQSIERVGAPFRMEIIKNGPGTLREKMLSYDPDQDSESELSVTACLVLQDSDLGYFLITSVNGAVQAATLDQPYPEITSASEEDRGDTFIPDINIFTPGPPRKTYQAAKAFFHESSLPSFLKDNVPARHHRLVNQEIRLSSAILDLMTQAHRVLSNETNRLGLAAADLFRRCERLQDELRDQISRASEVAQRTDEVAGEDFGRYLGGGRRKGHLGLEERLDNVRERHRELTTRHEALRRKFSRHGGNELSEKEKSWIAEVEKTRAFVKSPDPGQGENGETASEMWRRCHEAQEFAEDLIAHAKASSPDDGKVDDDDTYMIPSDLRKAKTAQVMQLLDRESALVEAAQTRLERLNIAVVS